MQPLEFMRRVLPAQGVYCIVGIAGKTDPVVQQFAENIDELKPLIGANMKAGRNVYFAQSSFKTNQSRKADNALLTRAMFLDIEENGDAHANATAGYESKEVITDVINAFSAEHGLSVPYLVDSGYGIHVYWAFTEDVPTSEWKRVADGFKAMLEVKGIRIDRSAAAGSPG